MIRAVTITFDVDSETGDVTNVKTQVEGEVKRKRTTTKKSEVVEKLEDTPIILREESKLVLNNRAVADMGIEYGDRVFVVYEKIGKKLIPVIGPSDDNGNKITKTNTVAFKGNQNTVLAEYGTEFTIEPYKDNTWKLIPTGENALVESIEQAIEVAQEIDPVLLVETDDVYEIDEVQFKF